MLERLEYLVRSFSSVFDFRGRELARAALLFTALSFLVYGWYAFHGGFIADDWVNADHYYFHPGSGFWGAIQNYQTPSRPVAAVYVSLTYALLGTHTHEHLVLSVLLAGFLSTAFFAFLRTLGLSWPLALAAAGLLLVFPSSDSTRFWTTGSQINLFIGLYLCAITIGIAGRRRCGAAATRPAVLTQVAASALAVIAVAGYEIVAPAVLLSFVFYRWAGGKGGTLWRWLCDAIPTALVLIFFTRKFDNEPAHGMQLLTNVRLAADGALSVLGYTLVPSRDLSRWLVVLGVVGVILATFLVKRFAPRLPDRESVTRWTVPLLLALGGVVVGYAMLIPAVDRYPLYAPGVQNRTNCFAALGFSVLVVFLAAAVAALVAAMVPRISRPARAQLRGVLTLALVFAMIGVYAVRIVQDERRWTKAAEDQAQIFAGTRELVPSPPADVTIFTSPYPGYSSRSIPIFGGGGNNDELGAFRVFYGSAQMRAFPLLEGNGLLCGLTAMKTPDGRRSETKYGKAIFVDLRQRVVYRPRSRAACLRDTNAMEPFGPVNLSEEW